MDTPQLDYAGPTTPKWTLNPSPVVTAVAFLALLMLLAVLVLPTVPRHSRPSKVPAAQTDVSMLGAALELFRQDIGRYPTDTEGLDALATQPAGMSAWAGPYMKRGVPNDPWGNVYLYHATKQSGGKQYSLLSRGPDGVEGTSDDIPAK